MDVPSSSCWCWPLRQGFHALLLLLSLRPQTIWTQSKLQIWASRVPRAMFLQASYDDTYPQTMSRQLVSAAQLENWNFRDEAKTFFSRQNFFQKKVFFGHMYEDGSEILSIAIGVAPMRQLFVRSDKIYLRLSDIPSILGSPPQLASRRFVIHRLVPPLVVLRPKTKNKKRCVAKNISL